MALRWYVFFLSSALLLACSGPLEVSGVTRDTDTFSHFPVVMQQFPVWQPIDVALYDFEVRDGARRPSGGLRYLSGLSADAISDRFRTEANALGCEISEERAGRLRTTCNGDPARSLELYLEAADGDGSKVIVLFIQTTPEFETVAF